MTNLKARAESAAFRLNEKFNTYPRVTWFDLMVAAFETEMADAARDAAVINGEPLLKLEDLLPNARIRITEEGEDYAAGVFRIACSSPVINGKVDVGFIGDTDCWTMTAETIKGWTLVEPGKKLG